MDEHTPYGSQSAALPSPNLPDGPAGCRLSEGERYAFAETMDGPPDPLTDYAERRGQ